MNNVRMLLTKMICLMLLINEKNPDAIFIAVSFLYSKCSTAGLPQCVGMITFLLRGGGL